MNSKKRVVWGVMASIFLLQFEMLSSARNNAVLGSLEGFNEVASQRVFADKDISGMKDLINKHFCNLFKKRFEINRDRLHQFDQFFVQHSLHPSLVVKGDSLHEIKILLGHVYELIQRDMPGFITYLKKNGFNNGELNQEEEQTYFNDVIQKYEQFARLLFTQDNKEREQEFLFSTANHFFEYCFSDVTWSNFQELLNDKENYPIVRFLYSTMWYFLAGRGWNDWHIQTLNNLKKVYKQGGWVTYIAGGSDIYQLLKHGIFRIRVIDPLLPSQAPYYVQGLEWFVNSLNVGDEFAFHTDDGLDLILRRKRCRAKGTFVATLASGIKQTLPKTITEWIVLDKNTKKLLGNIIFERRFCCQNDFVATPKNSILMSFNELYFVFTNDAADNWGINVQKISKNAEFFIKQLRFPITKQTLCHLRVADGSQFQFIKLGTAIN